VTNAEGRKKTRAERLSMPLARDVVARYAKGVGDQGWYKSRASSRRPAAR
jgi:hypothetical protein